MASIGHDVGTYAEGTRVKIEPEAVVLAVLALCITMGLYAFVPYEHPSMMEGVLKCLPIIILMICVYLYGDKLEAIPNKLFSKKILYGLISGCIGDYLLIWPGYFEAGILAFAIGHIHYIRAFGFTTPNLRLGAGLYGCLLIIIIWLQYELSGILAVAIPMYGVIIVAMVWRAISRHKDYESWPTLCAAVGAACFVFSDFCIAINKFKYTLPYEAFLVMATYYVAQIGISLSVLELHYDR